MKTVTFGLICSLFLLGSAPTAFADDNSVDIESAEPRDFELKIGGGYGGPIGLVFPIEGLERTTTQPFSGFLSARMRLPKVSPRVLELYAVIPNGVGVNIKNDDFQIGDVRVHLLDIGLFYNVWNPVSVQRVDRKWDLTFGFGATWRVQERWEMTFDWRMYVPANVPKVLTDYGDFARLIGRESVQGGQLWLGVSYRL